MSLYKNFLHELVDIGQYILYLALASGCHHKELIFMVIEVFLIVSVYVSRPMKSVTYGNQNLNEDIGKQDVLQRLTRIGLEI